jgi:hypothetical protein
MTGNESEGMSNARLGPGPAQRELGSELAAKLMLSERARTTTGAPGTPRRIECWGGVGEVRLHASAFCAERPSLARTFPPAR